MASLFYFRQDKLLFFFFLVVFNKTYDDIISSQPHSCTLNPIWIGPILPKLTRCFPSDNLQKLPVPIAVLLYLTMAWHAQWLI